MKRNVETSRETPSSASVYNSLTAQYYYYFHLDKKKRATVHDAVWKNVREAGESRTRLTNNTGGLRKKRTPIYSVQAEGIVKSSKVPMLIKYARALILALHAALKLNKQYHGRLPSIAIVR